MSENRGRLEELFERHRTAVYRYAVRRVGPDLADEVLAETFVVAWRKLDDVPSDAEPPWLLATARLVTMNLTRAARRRDLATNNLDPPRPEPDHAERVADALDIRRALAQLRDADQEVLRLVEWDGLTHDEAAKVLGCSRAAVGVRVRRARKRLIRAFGALSPSGASLSTQSPSTPMPSSPSRPAPPPITRSAMTDEAPARQVARTEPGRPSDSRSPRPDDTEFHRISPPQPGGLSHA